MKTVQTGAATVEFNLVLVMFLMFMLAVTDFSRMLFAWNAATEATRLGARYAVVCDSTTNKPAVLARMQAMQPDIADIALAWNPAGCTSSVRSRRARSDANSSTRSASMAFSTIV